MRRISLGCVLMAAGNSARFGGNKLQAELNGKSFLLRALEAIPREEFARVAVVSQYRWALELAKEFGFAPILNDRPDDGVSRTIALGLEALGKVSAAMFLVADQPCLLQSCIQGEIDFFRRDPSRIVAMGYGRRRGNPAIFPKKYFDELSALSGDDGGSRVIRAHEDALALYQVADELQLMDVDCAEELAALKERMGR